MELNLNQFLDRIFKSNPNRVESSNRIESFSEALHRIKSNQVKSNQLTRSHTMVYPLMLDLEAERFLSFLPMFTGFLSVLGSGWLIIEIVTTRSKLHTVYNRLLLSMSIIDVFVSIAYMFSTIPSPKSSYEVIWAFGNIQTCTAQGFFIQLGIIPPICKFTGNKFT